MHRTLTTALALVLASLAGRVATPESKGQTARDQMSFCEDGAPNDLVLKPAPLSSAVLTAVMNTKEGKEARQLAEGTGLAPEKLLKGTKVHMTGSHELFLVVMGSWPLSGADNTWFWVVRESGKSATVLLFAGANCLEVSQTKTLGYKDVVTTWSSALTTETEIYRYDGKSYKLWQRKSKPVSWQ